MFFNNRSVIYFPAIMQLIAFRHLINVLKTYEYQSLGLGGFNEVDGSLNTNAKLPKDELQYALADSYYNIVKKTVMPTTRKQIFIKRNREDIHFNNRNCISVYD